MLAAGTANAEDLTVYTALEADQIKAYEAAFAKANPDIKISWIRDSTGVVTAKLLAGKANPQADVVFGLAATSLMLLDKDTCCRPTRRLALDKRKRCATPLTRRLGRHGRVSVRSVLQYHRSRQEKCSNACFLGRPPQARI
jgi:hypothetical protein